MAKKIVEVPEGAVNIIFEPAVEANYANEVSYMLKHQVGVENLPDVTDYVLHENDFYTENQVHEILIKFSNEYILFIDDMTVEQIVDEFMEGGE